ncbi:MAG: hypothetical protein KIT57_16835 [Blastocatellales bacterium]|nr:hypothetical protein [Blastocatellales bacterium]
MWTMKIHIRRKAGIWRRARRCACNITTTYGYDGLNRNTRSPLIRLLTHARLRDGDAGASEDQIPGGNGVRVTINGYDVSWAGAAVAKSAVLYQQRVGPSYTVEHNTIFSGQRNGADLSVRAHYDDELRRGGTFEHLQRELRATEHRGIT